MRSEGKDGAARGAVPGVQTYLDLDEDPLPLLPEPVLLVAVLPPPVLVEEALRLPGLALPPLMVVPALPMPLGPARLLEPLCPVEP